MMINLKDALLDRFLRYVKIDTQSDPESECSPSTEKQKNLGRILVEELEAFGLQNAEMDDFGVVYATLSRNSTKTDVPKIMFCSHMDTSPDCSGENVKPIIHENYQGQDLILPDDNSQVIRMSEHPDLKHQLGNDIITASGTTLLGADNKAGLAAIMTALEYLAKHPEIKHGDIKILFTPDEEVGRGTENVDLKRLDADFGYTVDGETLGSIENETFSADGVEIRIHGVSAHPGFAKGKMQNALKIGAEIIAALPKEILSPETTESKEGFIHPTDIQGNVELCKLSFIVRDFDESGLLKKENLLKEIVEDVLKEYDNSSFEFMVKEQYRNMKVVLDNYPQVTENAIQAIKRAGIEPKLQSIRGGTDGSKLSFMGLPCPNIFAGEHAFHSKLEWVSVQDMLKAAEVIVNLAIIYEEKA
ncbi:peptidase T [Lacihabitans soyangensis]|uniref:Peptidase T n=2 Tax=Lacihabitans soyangensis TaxID=869394 RepID=A0AAE3H2Y2_9BACT|nr:peptidase T [Lacihabitans soyangensis]MCP9761910.1 peptidase T [Lacihabitans soyangensis]